MVYRTQPIRPLCTHCGELARGICGRCGRPLCRRHRGACCRKRVPVARAAAAVAVPPAQRRPEGELFGVVLMLPLGLMGLFWALLSVIGLLLPLAALLR
jgi:hypothetical protein